MKISREFATSLTIGAFAIMSVTGVLMFFHKDTGVNKMAHEWLGWIMIAAVILHVTCHSASFKRYFYSGTWGRILIPSCLLVLGTSFFIDKPSNSQSPAVMAIKAIVNAPIDDVARLSGQSANELRKNLVSGGLKLEANHVKLNEVTRGNSQLERRAVKIIFSNTPTTKGH